MVAGVLSGFAAEGAGAEEAGREAYLRAGAGGPQREGTAAGPGTGATGRGGPVGAAGWPGATSQGGRRRQRHDPARELPVGSAAGLAAGR